MIIVNLKLLIITLLLSFNVIQASTSIQLTQKEKIFIKENPIITLGAGTSFEPYIIKKENGTLTGYDKDIALLIEEKTGLKIEFEVGNWLQIQEKAKNRKVDGLSTVIHTKEREKYYNFSTPYIETSTIVLLNSGNPKKIFNKNDFIGKKISVQEGNKLFTKIAKSLEGVEIVYYPKQDDVLKAVISQEVDFTVLNEVIFYMVNKMGLKNLVQPSFVIGEPISFRFALRSDKPELVSIINKALAKLDTKEILNIREKWFSSKVIKNKIELSLNEFNYLTKKKEITMCFDPNWMPYERFENNKYTGMNSEYIKIFEENIGIPIRPIKTTSWAESIEFAKKRKCDILSLLKETPSRKKYLNFTTPYMTPSVVLATKANVAFIDNLQQLKTEKVGVVKGYSSKEVLLQQYPHMKIINVENIEDGLKKVINGELFGVIDALPTIAYRIQGEFIGQLKISAKVIDKWEMGIGVRNDDLTLLNILNKAIENLPKHIESTIFNKYIGIKYEKRFDYTLFWQIFAIFTALAVFLYVKFHIINNYNKKMKEYLHLIDNNFLSSSTDKDGNITEVSEALCRTTGYSKEELIGKKHNIFRHKDMPNSTFKEMWETISSGKVWRGDIKNLNKDGSYYWADSKITPIFNKVGSIKGFHALRFDITDRKKLKSTHDLLSKLASNIPGFIYQYKIDPDGHSSMPYASKGIVEVIELEHKDVIHNAQAVIDIIHSDDLDMVNTAIQKSIKNMDNWNVQYRVNLPKKGMCWLEGFARPERLEDGSIIAHGYIHDITDAKSKDEFMVVQSRHAAMGEMIGMIAHQWRQPLAVISMDMNNMLVDIDLEDFNETEARNYANNVLDHTKNLSKTIDDFRNFFKSDKTLSKVKIKDVLKDTYSIIKPSLVNNNIELITTFESKLEIDTYPRELMQVFLNIINNAKDALLLNKIHNASIEIKVYENDNHVFIDIFDNALGIDAKILPQIFDPYFSTKDEKNGTGLGLYMSKTIVEDHLHGKLEALCIDNRTCFRIIFKKI